MVLMNLFNDVKTRMRLSEKTDSQPLIKPLELKTFLKVGKFAVLKVVEQHLMHVCWHPQYVHVCLIFHCKKKISALQQNFLL
jgi:hypothetical protein